MTTCQHVWVKKTDWEGDPSFPGGVNHWVWWECAECDEVSDDQPDGYEAPFQEPDPVDETDYAEDRYADRQMGERYELDR